MSNACLGFWKGHLYCQRSCTVYFLFNFRGKSYTDKDSHETDYLGISDLTSSCWCANGTDQQMLRLAFIRQFPSRYWPSLLLLLPHLRYHLEKTKIKGHSHTGTLDRLEMTFFRDQF